MLDKALMPGVDIVTSSGRYTWSEEQTLVVADLNHLNTNVKNCQRKHIFNVIGGNEMLDF